MTLQVVAKQREAASLQVLLEVRPNRVGTRETLPREASFLVANQLFEALAIENAGEHPALIGGLQLAHTTRQRGDHLLHGGIPKAVDDGLALGCGGFVPLLASRLQRLFLPVFRTAKMREHLAPHRRAEKAKFAPHMPVSALDEPHHAKDDVLHELVANSPGNFAVRIRARVRGAREFSGKLVSRRRRRMVPVVLRRFVHRHWSCPRGPQVYHTIGKTGVRNVPKYFWLREVRADFFAHR